MKKRLMIFALCLVFIVPMLASGLLFYFNDRFPLKHSNHGTLINPPLRIETLFHQQNNEKKWLLLYACQENCLETVQILKQIQKALGQMGPRTQVVLYPFLGAPRSRNHTIYLVDPRGYVFMQYADTSNPMNILKDMKHVLEVSQIG